MLKLFSIVFMLSKPGKYWALDYAFGLVVHIDLFKHMGETNTTQCKL